MTRRILIVLGLVLAIAGTVWLCVHGYESWRTAQVEEGDRAGYGRCKAEWAEANTKQAAKIVKALADARAEEQAKAAAAIQGERDARERAETEAKRQAAAARRAASAAGGLSGDLAALDRAANSLGIPDAAACPGQFAAQRDAAIRARALFGACSAEYRVLAETAGSEGAAVRLQLDTALSWIRATGAPGADK